MRKYFFVLANIFLNLGRAAQTLQSPDKQLQLRFELKDNMPYYNLDYKNIPVVKQSNLGLTLVKYHFIIGWICKQGIKTKLEPTSIFICLISSLSIVYNTINAFLIFFSERYCS